MTNGLKILTAGLLVAFSAFAQPKLDDFYGIRLGMTQAQFLSVMKAKGFEEFIDLDTNKKWKPSKKTSFCTRETNNTLNLKGTYLVLCGGREKSPDSISHVAVIFSKDALHLLSVVFDQTQAKEALPGIIGKFGYPTATSTFLTRPPHEIRKWCLQNSCGQGTWTSGERELRVVFNGINISSSDSGVIYLFMVDNAAVLKMQTLHRVTQEKKGKIKAAELGF